VRVYPTDVGVVASDDGVTESDVASAASDDSVTAIVYRKKSHQSVVKMAY
jgi:hypothetical protein